MSSTVKLADLLNVRGFIKRTKESDLEMVTEFDVEDAKSVYYGVFYNSCSQLVTVDNRE